MVINVVEEMMKWCYNSRQLRYLTISDTYYWLLYLPGDMWGSIAVRINILEEMMLQFDSVSEDPVILRVNRNVIWSNSNLTLNNDDGVIILFFILFLFYKIRHELELQSYNRIYIN